MPFRVALPLDVYDSYFEHFSFTSNYLQATDNLLFVVDNFFWLQEL
jgi:hypothetical protein